MVRAAEEEEIEHLELGDEGTQNDDNRCCSDMEMMKEKFAKLLLGEDMSGGGKGVSSAMALSNAITNLAASVFGEQSRLEPMPEERKARWRKEIDWLLSVTDHIVEFVPSKQNTNGVDREVMVTRQRSDIHMNIPALKKLDAMLLECLDNFAGDHEFTYASKDDHKARSIKKREEDKWWLPTPKVPPNGLSEGARKWLQFQKDSVHQVLKAALAINAQILMEMEIPENYIETLPKNGRASLGDYIYKAITVEHFDPDLFLSSMDLSTEHKIVDLKNRIEASVVIWKRKMSAKDGRSGWGSGVSLEKREQFGDRAETILLILKQRYPGIPQSTLEISKIEHNRDVGLAILESYSRILESLAHKVLSRIEDVQHVDALAQNPSLGSLKRNSLKDSIKIQASGKFPYAVEETIKAQ
ncbi:rop guanine nucleotide exchange factor 12-like [Cynara cardunculus var. scolymus]|uniref:rop guanine nucleotide exchange factor 12-like n=1 Tax=Cynara cardunculus var. scolymus TaxID=59895 RepID=UPI000D626EC3|nr:rop guanine nucleotide exchange factor 12-like [Cynara cardunculus var. scolymus]